MCSRRDSAADFEHCAGHSYSWLNCPPGMHWVALLWTFQINSYTLTQHWSNFLSISIPLAVLPVPSAFSTAVKPCCRCWTSHGTFLFRSTPLTESITTLLPDNSNIVSVYLSFVKLGAVRTNAKLMFWQGFKTHAYILQIETPKIYIQKNLSTYFMGMTPLLCWQSNEFDKIDKFHPLESFQINCKFHCSSPR